MGPNANDSVMMWGNYSGYPTRTITILQGIRRKAGNVKYIQGCQLTKNEVENSRYSMIKSPDGQKGMKATYWNNTNMEGEPVTTAYMREPINLSNGGATVFAPGVNLEKFSARYEGLFTPDQDETLTLSIGCDDKARVILDGDTVINRWKSRQRIDYQQVKRNFKAGKTYTIQIDYVQENDMAAIQFDLTKKTTPTKEQLLAETGDAETVIFHCSRREQHRFRWEDIPGDRVQAGWQGGYMFVILVGGQQRKVGLSRFSAGFKGFERTLEAAGVLKRIGITTAADFKRSAEQIFGQFEEYREAHPGSVRPKPEGDCVPCPDCEGKGIIAKRVLKLDVGKVCKTCNGSGYVPK